LAFSAAAFAQQNSTEANSTMTTDHAAEAAIKQVLGFWLPALEWNLTHFHELRSAPACEAAHPVVSSFSPSS
jgi:hypothetical protein